MLVFRIPGRRKYTLSIGVDVASGERQSCHQEVGEAVVGMHRTPILKRIPFSLRRLLHPAEKSLTKSHRRTIMNSGIPVSA